MDDEVMQKVIHPVASHFKGGGWADDGYAK